MNKALAFLQGYLYKSANVFSMGPADVDNTEVPAVPAGDVEAPENADTTPDSHKLHSPGEVATTLAQ